MKISRGSEEDVSPSSVSSLYLVHTGHNERETEIAPAEKEEEGSEAEADKLVYNRAVDPSVSRCDQRRCSVVR